MTTERLRLMGPVIFRIILIIVAGFAVAGLANPYWGLGCVIAGLLAEMGLHLNYIARLDEWLEKSMTASPKTDEETPTTASALWSDIFSRVYEARAAFDKNARRLEDREARYRKTLGALPEGIILTKRNWLLSWCNPQAEKIFPLSGEKDVGRSVLALITDPAIDSFLRTEKFDVPLNWTQAETGRTYEIRVVIADKNNSLLIARDVTEQTKVDAMRRDFVANVSHELRTPLTVLSGFLDMAVAGVSGKVELAPQHLALMRDQAQRMKRIIDDLLTLSRLENGGEDKESEMIALHDLVRRVTAEMEVVAAGRYTVDCTTEDVWIEGYADEMRSAVVNLMTNALRYTPEGGHIHAECRKTAAGGAEIMVRDNGIGIAQKDIPRLTERFYRVDKSRSRDTGGTGLGLAIVKHVMLHHNAQMKIESELGKGSAFTLELPPERVRTGGVAA